MIRNLSKGEALLGGMAGLFAIVGIACLATGQQDNNANPAGAVIAYLLPFVFSGIAGVLHRNRIREQSSSNNPVAVLPVAGTHVAGTQETHPQPAG